MTSRYVLYLLRWQLSSLILAPVIGIVKGTSLLGNASDWVSAIVANLIGGLVFFWIDRLIFAKSGKTTEIKSQKVEVIKTVNDYCPICGKKHDIEICRQGNRLFYRCNNSDTDNEYYDGLIMKVNHLLK